MGVNVSMPPKFFKQLTAVAVVTQKILRILIVIPFISSLSFRHDANGVFLLHKNIKPHFLFPSSTKVVHNQVRHFTDGVFVLLFISAFVYLFTKSFFIVNSLHCLISRANHVIFYFIFRKKSPKRTVHVTWACRRHAS